MKKRHTSLFSGIWREIRKKIHQKFAEKMQNSDFLRLKFIELMRFINSIANCFWRFLTKKLRLENGATEPWYCRRIPSIFASLPHVLYSRSRARVALGRELQLPMSFPWPVFPGLDQDLFPPWFSSFFGIRFQSGAKECIV